MNVLITGHRSLSNRGCEALLRATVGMIRARDSQARFFVPSIEPSWDRLQWPQSAEQGVHFIDVPRDSVQARLWSRAARAWPAMLRGPWPRATPPGDWHDAVRRSDAMLCIGGDNYTLDYGLDSLAHHVGISQWVIRHGVPSVLWGASVGPFNAPVNGRATPLMPTMARHLRHMQAITVRESLSLAVLQELLHGEAAALGLAWNPCTLDAQGLKMGMQPGVPPWVQPVADPAFTLEPEAVDLAPYWPDGTAPVLGLNISPLVIPKVTPERNAWLDTLARFIRDVRKTDRCRVLLVPHVTARQVQGGITRALTPAQDDDALIDQLQLRLSGVDGIGRLPAWNAAQLKHGIAHCDLFMGSRTHSVIAALSSGVPAVALAYSLKGRGIHRDLLGDERGVLPVAQLDGHRLTEALDGLLQRTASERALLHNRMPLWQARARSATGVLFPLGPPA